MPFEPINTDEKLEGRPNSRKPKTDFERQLMSGCMVILVCCFLVYGLSVWPWFVAGEESPFKTYTVQGLINALAIGCGSASVIGLFATIKFKLAGGAGFMGGSFAGGVFMFLRLQQIMLGKGHNDLPQPEFPERWMYLVPLAWVLLTVALVAIFMPKELEDHPASPEDSQQ